MFSIWRKYQKPLGNSLALSKATSQIFGRSDILQIYIIFPPYSNYY